MYRVTIDKSLLPRLKKLDHCNLSRLDRFVKRLESLENPRSIGNPLTGNKAGFWRYRIGDYRMVCEIRDGEMTIVAFEFAHRSRVYR